MTDISRLKITKSKVLVPLEGSTHSASIMSQVEVQEQLEVDIYMSR